MKTTNYKFQPRTSLILLIAIACAICGTSYAQTVIGTAGAGFQTWNAGDLNDSGAPYWDTIWGASRGPACSPGQVPCDQEGSPANRNIGFCMTSSGDCQGIGSALFAPGALPFWGMAYNPTTDTGGARDPKVYFKSSASSTELSTASTLSTGTQTLRATLYINLSANAAEINEFGWFETNSTGSVIGTTHLLFQGSPTPSPVGAITSFTPTQYFGYYYRDFSEGNCFTYTLFNFNDANCTGPFNEHDFVVFTTNPSSTHATFWIAGEDPAACNMNDADCNLTLVKVQAAEN